MLYCHTTRPVPHAPCRAQDGTPLRGVNLRCMLQDPSQTVGPHRFLLQGVIAPTESPDPPSITALDCHPVSNLSRWSCVCVVSTGDALLCSGRTAMTRCAIVW